MDLSSCLIIYIFVVILIIIICYKLNRTIWSSILFGSLIGMVFLLIIKPPSEINYWSTGTESSSAIYLMVMVLTPLYVIVYSLVRAQSDIRKIKKC